MRQFRPGNNNQVIFETSSYAYFRLLYAAVELRLSQFFPNSTLIDIRFEQKITDTNSNSTIVGGQED